MKKIIYTLLGLVIIAVVAVVVLLNPIGKSKSEEYATRLLGTPVTISQFDADILDKRVAINFVEVKNPPNFNNKNALSLDHFTLKVGDMGDDLIVVDELIFDGLEFVLEQNDANVNLTQLIDNLAQSQSSSGSSSDSRRSDANEQRIKIEKFKVNNIVLKVDTEFLRTDVNVPNIAINNFGGNSGVGISQIGKEITDEVLQSLKKALEKKGIEAGKEKIKETLMRKIGDKLGIDNLQEKMNMDNVKDSIGSGYDNVKDKVKETVKEQFDDKLKDQAKDLFKKIGF